MHEFGIVREIFDEIEKSGKTKKAIVKMGALKSVDPEIFREMFSSLVQDSALAEMEVKIITVPLVVKCPECGFEGEIKDIPHLHTPFVTWPCPKCGSEARILSGNEQEIVELE